MCNLYRMTQTTDEIAKLLKAIRAQITARKSIPAILDWLLPKGGRGQ